MNIIMGYVALAAIAGTIILEPSHSNSFEDQAFEDQALIIWRLATNLGAVSIRKTVLPGMAIPMLR